MTLRKSVENPQGQSLDGTYVVFDLETTGFSPVKNRIIEIGAVKVENGEITDKFSTFVNPEVPDSHSEIEELTEHQRRIWCMDAPTIEEILPEFLKFCEGAVMVAHNASFDMSFIEENCRTTGPCPANLPVWIRWRWPVFLLPQLNRAKLDTVAKALNVSLENHHRAVDDAGCTAEIFVKFVAYAEGAGILKT